MTLSPETQQKDFHKCVVIDLVDSVGHLKHKEGAESSTGVKSQSVFATTEYQQVKFQCSNVFETSIDYKEVSSLESISKSLFERHKIRKP